MNSEQTLAVMFAGWLMMFYGVRRRDWPGTVTALAGAGLASVPMILEAANKADDEQ